MTVIAFDGNSMASDRQGEYYYTKTQRTKIQRVGHAIVGGAGTVCATEAMIKWLEAGANIEKFPKIAEADKSTLLVGGPEGVWLYENSPYPMKLRNKFFAIGSGSDAAMAAWCDFHDDVYQQLGALAWMQAEYVERHIKERSI